MTKVIIFLFGSEPTEQIARKYVNKKVNRLKFRYTRQVETNFKDFQKENLSGKEKDKKIPFYNILILPVLYFGTNYILTVSELFYICS